MNDDSKQWSKLLQSIAKAGDPIVGRDLLRIEIEGNRSCFTSTWRSAWRRN